MDYIQTINSSIMLSFIYCACTGCLYLLYKFVMPNDSNVVAVQSERDDNLSEVRIITSRLVCQVPLVAQTASARRFPTSRYLRY